MDAKGIESMVVAALKQAQEISGEDFVEIGLGDKPLGKLDGFDSLKGIEVTVMIEGELGCEIERDSLFVWEDRATTLAEICAYLGEVTAAQEKAVA